MYPIQQSSSTSIRSKPKGTWWYVAKRLADRQRLKKVFIERLTEPIHLNVLATFVALFGNYKSKVAFDLVVRPQYAFPIMFAAELAKKNGFKKLTILEFGVASGAGLLNMCALTKRTTIVTGVDFEIYGFDSGLGMPAAVDYRDMPEHFQKGDFPMLDSDRLTRSLPNNAKLIIGDVADTVPKFLSKMNSLPPIGFVAIDLDYYSATKAALPILLSRPEHYLPIVPVYLDDIAVTSSCPWTGEELAVHEFNRDHELRKIVPFNLLRSRRIFKNTQWLDRMFAAHILDHHLRSPAAQTANQRFIYNEYLS